MDMTNLLNSWKADRASDAKAKILIIDDEPGNVTLLEDMLAESGYTRIKSITDSRLALETVAAFEPDLLLLDWMMPHVNGNAVLEGVRAAHGETYLPVIVLTADTTEKSKLHALRSGATDFLTKPFDHMEVILRIRNLLETRRLHLLLDNQRAAFEEAVRNRSMELREVQAQLESQPG